MHFFQVFGIKTEFRVQIFNEIRSRSCSNFFGTGAGAGVKKVTPTISDAGAELPDFFNMQ